jgi:glycosyltransferase involved in cell wall biosynthesis
MGILTPAISIILPARNEAAGLALTLPRLRQLYPDAELIVVDDGSTDETSQVAESNGAQVLRSPYGMGNGAAIKRGTRSATGDILVFMDADGQHDPSDIARLLEKLEQGFDMVAARPMSSGASPMGSITAWRVK